MVPTRAGRRLVFDVSTLTAPPLENPVDSHKDSMEGASLY
jgi:hypothetical protein